ncbi:hypothetical protein [Fulvivirga ligni]|nr:hypothetical protein [Fulvivirga ligni]
MKFRLLLVLLVVFGLSACSQYTCPTYSKKDVEKKENTISQEKI